MPILEVYDHIIKCVQNKTLLSGIAILAATISIFKYVWK